jgi:hypothetical protein
MISDPANTGVAREGLLETFGDSERMVVEDVFPIEERI